ncbi:MAG: hypothetical protein QOI95_3712 [Acidimicrobiaceae bacterium]|jgi:uncharacterized protein
MTSAPGPLDIGVAELLRRLGTQREVTVSAALDDIAISSAAVVDGAEIEGRFVLEAMSDHAITVKGTITAPWTGECRRCLRTIDGTVSLDVDEVFDARPVEGETYPLDGDRLNVEPLVRDAVLLSLPLAPLCEVACAGPEPKEHPIGSDVSEAIDPRWAGLGDLKFD